MARRDKDDDSAGLSSIRYPGPAYRGAPISPDGHVLFPQPDVIASNFLPKVGCTLVPGRFDRRLGDFTLHFPTYILA
jgi:hypothetical protein